MTTPPSGSPGDATPEQPPSDPNGPFDYPDYSPPPSAYPPPPAYPPPNPAPPPGYSAPYPPQYPASGGYPPPPGAFPPPVPGYPPPPNPYDPYGIPPQQGTNNMAIASLVTSLSGIGVTLFCCFVGLIAGPLLQITGIALGIVGLGQVNRDGQNGRGLAIAGIVVGAVGLLLTALFVVGLLATGSLSTDYSTI
jgi:hypothetical protein